MNSKYSVTMHLAEWILEVHKYVHAEVGISIYVQKRVIKCYSRT
jgi:hypothetical protein